MNSGLPSLLDAIFGKQNLDSVSIDEIYELIDEFPSFNAGHFLLSKKLKEQEETGYEKETMRTALYFNNPFWLESILNEENQGVSGKISSETSVREIRIEEFIAEPEPLLFDQPSSVQSDKPQQPAEENPVVENKTESLQSIQEEPLPEYTEGPVRSFDELISKYHITPLTAGEETLSESLSSATDEVVDTMQPVEKTEFREDSNLVAEEEPAITQNETVSGNVILDVVAEDYEIREEVVNEYGIFEEVKVKKTDFDLEAFDKPVTNVPEEYAPADDLILNEIPEFLNDSKNENPGQEGSDEKQIQEDYEAFDRPIDNQVHEETESAPDLTSEEESISEIYSGHEHRLESVETHMGADDTDDTETSEITSLEADSANDQMPGLADRYAEQQKKITSFDPKKAESIMFAPYHMIDYFASQGIKLVLEDHPADPLAKQLKSFTDWLKVMKRLPAQSIAEKTDDKEVDRIRHFAAHSIDEREILTESMAEVLAKQGMYENAIALFQKLSLIYPPKSAYFASRIEQLKASLP